MAPGFGEADRLRAELRAREVLGHPRIRLAEPLPVPCEERTAVFDLWTGQLLIGTHNDVLHADVPERHGLDALTYGRFVGGFVLICGKGRVHWKTISGTYAIDLRYVPPNFRDLIRGFGIHVLT